MGSQFNRRRQASLVLAALLLLTFAQGSATAFAATSQPLPADRLHFGVSSEPNRLAWMTGSGVPWRYRYTYLSAGVNTGQGWATWNQPAGQYATYYLDASHAAGYIPVFSYYMLLQSSPSTGPDERTRDFNNLNNPSTMAAYYADFKLLMEKAGAYGGPVVVQVEPDLWGYLQITSGNTTPDRVPAAVASSGQADAAGLPDNAQGFAAALLRMRDRYAPNVQMAVHASPWASMQDIASSTDPALDVVAEAARTVTFLNATGSWDLVFNDLDDHDAGWWEKNGGHHWWDPTNSRYPNFNRYLAWVGALHAGTGKPQISWQVPVGNQYFLTENNTCGHYQDNIAAYFLAHTVDLFNAGLIAVLFGAGNACQTTPADSQGDGITNNNGMPTTDLEGGCNACNTHVAQYADDDGGFLRIFVGQYYATPPPAAQLESILTATNNASYHLSTPNDGSFGSWVEIDPNLRVTQAPAVSGSSIVTANVDLWTARAGYNQDVGIFVATDGGPDVQLAWKESGGYAGTFSPNAAFVETVLPVLAGHTYVFTIKWKPNRPAPEQTIYAGAGTASTRFSPTRLTVRLLPVTSVGRAAQRKSYRLEGAGDGIAWAPVDPLLDVARQGTGATLRVSANMDLWTAQPGYNQDLGIFASDNGGPDVLVAWKESGGFAGTYSPNAAFVNAEYPTLAGHNYVFRLKWKTNVAAPGLTLFGAAGTATTEFSPTGVTVEEMGSGAFAGVTSSFAQHLDGANGGGFDSWVELNPRERVGITPATPALAVVTANMDLWTATAGYNQDLAIFSCDAMLSDCTLFTSFGLLAWKESGGFAGTYSPNAAAIQTVVGLASGHAYTFSLGWKPNRPAPAGVVNGAAGTTGSGFSPTSLLVQLGN